MALDALQGPITLAPEPAPPSRQFSFTDWQTNNPTAPPPGDKLDGEFDRTNTSVTQSIAWANTSLNTDGTIRPGTVGTPQLVTGLWQSIADDITDDVQGSVDQAAASASSALTSKNAASASASAAQTQSQAASASASTAQSAATSAQNSVTSAQTSANTASTAATTATNAASNATGAEAKGSDYAVLTQAWAEHMPDVIPPNILANMGVTGDHWSSRWWSNKAQGVVDNATSGIICSVQHYWMGAYASPPTVDSCSQPVTTGASYFNTGTAKVYVYDGAAWQQAQPGIGNLQNYVYLPATPVQGFTGPDYFGASLTLDPSYSTTSVYLNGVKLVDGLDFTVTPDKVTLSQSVGPPNVLAITTIAKAPVAVQSASVKLNTGSWVLNGTNKTFPMLDAVSAPVTPAAATDLIVSEDGVIQQAGADYTISGTNLTFITAPLSDATLWAVAGIPMGGP